jgi:hypothetical protein
MSRPTRNEQWLGIAIAAVLVLLVTAVRSFGADYRNVSVIAFSAPSCYQCQLDKKYYPAIRQRYKSLRVVDCDAEPEVAAAWGVKILPTYVVIHPYGRSYRTSKIAELLK